MFPPHTPSPDAADGQKPASLGFFLENDPKGKNISQTLPSFFISLKWLETNWAVSPADER